MSLAPGKTSNTRRLFKGLVTLAFLMVFGVVGLVILVFVSEHKPAPVEDVVVTDSKAPGALRAGDQVTVLVWNLQYSASRKHRCFYDGGDAVHVPLADVKETLEAIQALITKVDPDIALLQEIDRDSKRTAFIDQLPPLVEAMEGAAHASATYHRAAFVPKPFDNPLGQVDMNLGLISKPGLDSVQRHQLALMKENRVVQALNLKRALLTGEVPVANLGLPMGIGSTHLSAFSFGDGTLEKQVAQVAEWMATRPESQPWILAGDFNLLPPGDDKQRLATERDLYADDANPIEALFPRFQEVCEDPLAPEHRTYLPFGESEPDRKIDYVFYGGPLKLVEAEVLREASHISDHLPIRAVFEIVDPNAPDEEPPTVEEPPAEE